MSDERRATTSTCLEIRSTWPRAPSFQGELDRLSISLEATSRLIEVTVSPDGSTETQLCVDVLLDPLVEEVVETDRSLHSMPVCLDVFSLPGVTDREGEAAAHALRLVSPHLTEVHCRAGTRYRFAAPVSNSTRDAIQRLAGNPLIHQFSWSDEGIDGRAHSNVGGEPVEVVQHVCLEHRDAAVLLAMSRDLGLALDQPEMESIANHFRALARDPTDVEIQSLAQTWSEHCSHKTFKASIDMLDDGRPEHVFGLLATYIMAPTAHLARPWVRSAFVDNAGVIAFDDTHDLAFKVETHNHPSALDPFGGAHTGVGGVIRDVLAVSAEPIANTDVLCFGPPDLPEWDVPPGSFHPATTCREVVRGIAEYGNNIGIPTVGGAVLFHPGYVSNPLVFCGTIGIAPRGMHPTRPAAGDAVVVLGGRTGRDGLHGATMSSSSLDRTAVEGAAVQIGDPITEKTVRDVLPFLRDERLYHAITDCGAGGLCSAVGEMAETLGVEVDLDLAPLKYPGLLPWEIWLSEAQERVVLAVPPDALPQVFELCGDWGVEATAIGYFRDDGRLLLRYRNQVVADLSMEFLHGGRPARWLTARWDPPHSVPYRSGPAIDATNSLLALLRHPSIASKEEVIRQYDHEVGGATIGKPLVGDAGPSDAAVLKPLPSSWRGVVVAHGINPLYGSLDPRAMAMLAVDEALRNLVAVGGSVDYAALLDNFCWGDIDQESELGTLVRAARGCRDAALAYRVPFICGKDSLYNSSSTDGTVTSIPGTLLISAIGVIPDVRHTVSMDLKRAGNLVYLLGQTDDELGGSHYLYLRSLTGDRVPQVRPAETGKLFNGLTGAMSSGLVRSCHDLSEGGLAVAAAEMAIAGNLGLDLQLCDVPVVPHADRLSEEALLFGESPGRFLAEVAPENANRFEQALGSNPFAVVGTVTSDPHIVVRHEDRAVLDLGIPVAACAWRRQ